MHRSTHYLDHAASTPLRPQAIAATHEALSLVGNPSSLHGAGRAARKALEEAREQVAGCVGAQPAEVVLTSGGTEADNLAVKGVFWARRRADPRRRRVLVSATEHHAVLDPAAWLGTHDNAVVEALPVDTDGVLDVDALAESLARDDDVALVSVMGANNETGTVQPLDRVVELADARGVPVHADVVQAAAWRPLDLDTSGLAAASLSGHKLGGPVGVGALLLRRGTDLVALAHGGGQERDLRSGTGAVALACGLAAGLSAAVSARAEEVGTVARLRDDLERRVEAAVPDVEVNGAGAERLPGHAHLTVHGAPADGLLLLLDEVGVEVSAGSACSSGVAQPSHVLRAMGRDSLAATSSVRVSLGHTTTAADVDAFVTALQPTAERARAAGLLPVGGR